MTNQNEYIYILQVKTFEGKTTTIKEITVQSTVHKSLDHNY